MQLRQFSLCELMLWVTVAAIFLGIVKTLSPEEDGGMIFLGCWVLSVVVLRAIFGWLMPLLLSAAFGAATCGLFAFLAGQSTRPSRGMDATALGVVVGIAAGAAIAGSGIVAGWLIQKLATIRIRFPTPHNKPRGR
jgi:hypothetical protein